MLYAVYLNEKLTLESGYGFLSYGSKNIRLVFSKISILCQVIYLTM